MARAVPTRRGSVQVPPESGTRPSLENDWMKLADFAAMTRSHASAMLAPAPAATPFTAAMTGIGRLRRPAPAACSAARWIRRDRRPAAWRNGAIAEILAGTEAAACAREHQHAATLLVARVRWSASRTSSCIATLKLLRRSGPVEREARDAVG